MHNLDRLKRENISSSRETAQVEGAGEKTLPCEGRNGRIG